MCLKGEREGQRDGKAKFSGKGEGRFFRAKNAPKCSMFSSLLRVTGWWKLLVGLLKTKEQSKDSKVIINVCKLSLITEDLRVEISEIGIFYQINIQREWIKSS